MGGVLTFIALARLAPSDQTLSLSCLKFKLTKCTAASTSLPGSLQSFSAWMGSGRVDHHQSRRGGAAAGAGLFRPGREPVVMDVGAVLDIEMWPAGKGARWPAGSSPVMAATPLRCWNRP